MIIVSDNTATDLLFAKVGGTEAVNALMRSYGLDTIKATGPCSAWFEALAQRGDAAAFHREGKTPFGLSSPRDIARLLEKIQKGEAVSKQASEQMLQILRRQVYSSRLPKYITGFQVPHKTGDFLPYIGNDVGIFESRDRHVVIAVFTAHHTGVGANLEDAIARIAEQVANFYGFQSHERHHSARRAPARVWRAMIRSWRDFARSTGRSDRDDADRAVAAGHDAHASPGDLLADQLLDLGPVGVGLEPFPAGFVRRREHRPVPCSAGRIGAMATQV
jgi:hypothetical protein